MTILAASQIRLTPKDLGLARLSDNAKSDCFPRINELLQINHDHVNIFFRPVGGHNHTVHAILTVYAMGGSGEDLVRAFADNNHQQKEIPPVDHSVVRELQTTAGFLEYMRDGTQYSNFLKFFEQEIDARGWRDVVSEYCFTSSTVANAMFVQLFEGLYHPLIHVGFGVEFDQPALVAEGLAQAASHAWGNIGDYFARCEELAKKNAVPTTLPLQNLYHKALATEKIRTAAKLQMGPNRIRDGVMPNAMEELAEIAARFRVEESELEIEKKLVESTSCAAYNAAGAQRKGKAAKIDFFSMHTVTSSIFLSLLVHQDWIPIEYKARLVAWKGRLDLAWYASCGTPELDIEHVLSYQPTITKHMNWESLYAATIKLHDDGHVAKIVRALYSAENESKALLKKVGEDGIPTLPIHGPLWFRVAQMCLDSTTDYDLEHKWLMGTGFDPVWSQVEDET